MEESKVIFGRMTAYGILSQCFYYPNQLPPVFSEYTEEESALLKSAGLNLSDFSTIKIENIGDLLCELQKDYTRLFVTTLNGIPAPPYGSLYLDNKKAIWGDSTREVIKIYGNAGLKISEDFKDLPDHFAVELEFMFYLLREQLKASKILEWEKNDKSEECLDLSLLIKCEYEFMENHLLKWFDKFLNKVKESAKHPFYILLAESTNLFLANEKTKMKNRSNYVQN